LTTETDLICYLHPGWEPLIRPAPATRAWMDATPDSFAYRCLPLNIANAHGWEMLNPCGFDACWDGGIGPEAVTIRSEGGEAGAVRAPVSLFGQGVITFHVEGIFRTPPGWNMWVGGSPNRAKDGIHALCGVIETDWSPFTFTMNWRFTRPDHWVHFDAMEPFCFLFPVQRAAIERFRPRIEPLDSDPATQAGFVAWSQARDEFHRCMAQTPPSASADRWQKHYYRGVDVEGRALIDDHRSKLRLPAFDASAAPDLPVAPLGDPPETDSRSPTIERGRQTTGATAELNRTRRDLNRREWLLEATERQRALSQRASQILRREGLSGQDFLDEFYAPSRPVILTGEMKDWPALSRWTMAYLEGAVGSALVEYPSGPARDAQCEMDILMSRPGIADADVITRDASARAKALAPLYGDLGRLPKFLEPDRGEPTGLFWTGPKGAMTSLHHGLTNTFIAQIAGHSHIKLLPANEVGRLYNRDSVFSEIVKLDDPKLDFQTYPRLRGARVYDIVLAPGEILFIPLAWWRQITAPDFNVSVTYTNFLWPNEAYSDFPKE